MLTDAFTHGLSIGVTSRWRRRKIGAYYVRRRQLITHGSCRAVRDRQKIDFAIVCAACFLLVTAAGFIPDIFLSTFYAVS